MLLRGIAAAVSLIAGAALTMNLTQGEAAVPSLGEAVAASGKISSKMGLAPISIGNPATATALAALGMGRPLVTGPVTPDHTLSPPLAPETYQSPYKIKSGDTLGRILKRAGVSAQTAGKAIRALKGVYNPRDLRVGQTINVLFASIQTTPGIADRFNGFEIPINYAKRIHVGPAPEGGFKAFEIEQDFTTETVQAQGTIDWSLFAAGTKAGVSASVMAKLVRAFSWDVDFQRDIRKNDQFEVMYERKVDENGKVVYNGRIVYASLTLSGNLNPIYLHQLKNGNWDFFDDKGQSAQKALMRTPIDGARLSSSFGKRRHPVLGYTKMHKGTDFAAPRGTPIYAAGDGTIVKSGLNGSYGNYIKIRHNSEFSTAYAHMKSIKRGRTKGSRIRQGQVIGYVGTTGRSTGPHLHYEVLRNGRQTNPMRVKMPSGIKLKGEELKRFAVTRAGIQALQSRANKSGNAIIAERK